MKTRQATIFYCDHCNKKLLHKGYMERHEKECFANPDNQRHCFSCGYMERVEVKYDSGQSDHPEIERYYRTTQGFKCILKDKLLVPPKARFKNERSDTDISFVRYKGEETEQYDMPKDCDEFNSDPFPYGIERKTPGFNRGI